MFSSIIVITTIHAIPFVRGGEGDILISGWVRPPSDGVLAALFT